MTSVDDLKNAIERLASIISNLNAARVGAFRVSVDQKAIGSDGFEFGSPKSESQRIDETQEKYRREIADIRHNQRTGPEMIAGEIGSLLSWGGLSLRRVAGHGLRIFQRIEQAKLMREEEMRRRDIWERRQQEKKRRSEEKQIDERKKSIDKSEQEGIETLERVESIEDSRLSNDLRDLEKTREQELERIDREYNSKPNNSKDNIRQAIINATHDLIGGEFANHKMAPIHRIRDEVKKIFPEMTHEEFSEAMLDIKRSGESRLISIDDRSRATPDELSKSVHSVGETFFYAEKPTIEKKAIEGGLSEEDKKRKQKEIDQTNKTIDEQKKKKQEDLKEKQKTRRDQFVDEIDKQKSQIVEENKANGMTPEVAVGEKMFKPKGGLMSGSAALAGSLMGAVVAVKSFVDQVSKASDATGKAAERMGRYSPEMAYIAQQREIYNIQRQQIVGARTAAGASRAIQEEAKYKAATVEWEVMWEDLKNGFLTEALKNLTELVTVVNRIAGITDKPSQPQDTLITIAEDFAKNRR